MISPSNSIAVIRRQQRNESPVFWGIVFAGSLLIHLLLAVGMRSLLVQVGRMPVEPEPITVEFAEATDAAPPPRISLNQPPSPSAPSTPANAPPPSDAHSTAAATSSTHVPPSPESDIPLSTPESVRPVQTVPQARSPAAPAPTPANPTPNRATSTEPVASSLQPRLSNPTVQGPIASGIRLPDLPNVPNPADNPGRTPPASGLPINPLAIAKAPIPAKFLAQIQVLPGMDKGAIAPSTPGTPAAIQGESAQEFISDASNCLLTPDALSAFGKPVVLSVALDEQGQLQGEPTVLDQRSSGNSRYDELAACVLRRWTFSPAYEQVDESTRLFKPTTILVQVKITE